MFLQRWLHFRATPSWYFIFALYKNVFHDHSLSVSIIEPSIFSALSGLYSVSVYIFSPITLEKTKIQAHVIIKSYEVHLLNYFVTELCLFSIWENK